METNENGIELSEDVASNGSSSNSRILLAVGDLHGDYYRLIRYLRDMDLLLPGTMGWNPERNNVDVILIGDYTDWRGEAIEMAEDETTEDGALGAYRIIDLILHLDRELNLLRKVDPSFDSHFYPLVGNHDEMMLNSSEVFKFVSVEQLVELLGKARNFATWKRHLGDAGLNSEQIEHMYSFLNWYVQGGEITIRGFGGMTEWKEAMEGEIGEFLRNNLHLAVIVNKRLFSHSLPDLPRFWCPLQELIDLEQSDYMAAQESFTWGRKVWGYDYSSGVRTNPFTEKELTKMLNSIGANSAVIGHTPMSHSTEHCVAYDGLIVNIDVHGAPGGKAFIEEYEGSSSDNVAPLRSKSRSRKGVECIA